MKPSGSSRRRQRSPTSRRSTCRDKARRRSKQRAGVGEWGSHWGTGNVESESGRTSRWTGAGEGPWAGRLGRTCGRGDLSDVRPGLSVEDMLARRGAERGFGSLAGRLRGARGRWGRWARGRGQAWLQAGWRVGSWGRCCSRSRRLCPRCPAGCRKPPSPIQTSVKLSGRVCSRVTWRAIANPAPAPCAPLFPRVGCLKGTCGAC